ncbi:hypothetical protein [Pseudoalteromonas luteoviolacea]|uniref:hypothetical protein n=1 Tax=Pseudoalteromonas luteoviolacea TaxID=43657 RepID=UPI001152B818|nr:hypothetical protein [Pseudoalteromonas luteoviolacea]TQF70125.1 hypothetical protein FLM44_03255 [Pseudoalteromonas luteoviolacea]
MEFIFSLFIMASVAGIGFIFYVTLSFAWKLRKGTIKITESNDHTLFSKKILNIDQLEQPKSSSSKMKVGFSDSTSKVGVFILIGLKLSALFLILFAWYSISNT